MMTAIEVPNWLARRAVSHANVVAVENGPVSITYRQLDESARKLAAIIRTTAQVTDGSRVAVLMQSGWRYAVTVHSLIHAKCVLVPLNARLTARELCWQLGDSEASLVLYDRSLESLALSAVTEAEQNVETLCFEDIEDTLTGGEGLSSQPYTGEPLSGAESIVLSDIHAIIYTSGTTGYPKGTLLTYNNHWWSATACALQLGLTAEDRWLCPMPLFHVGGLQVLLRSTIYGITAVLHDRFDAANVHQIIDKGQATILSAVPTMLTRMLQVRTEVYPKSLRCVLLGGSSASPALIKHCAEFGLPIAPSYGLTETDSQFATLRPEEVSMKIGSSGLPLLPNAIQIVDDDGVKNPPGSPGRILVQGPSVTTGYWRNDEATARVLRDGWLDTGDIGYLDGDGYLFVLDRRSDLIVSGGENIYPTEVEAVLTEADFVMEACVVAEPDPVWGQAPVAYIVPTDRPSKADDYTEQVRQFCRERLAGYKVPKRIYLVDTLPRNASGKLLRRNLR